MGKRINLILLIDCSGSIIEGAKRGIMENAIVSTIQMFQSLAEHYSSIDTFICGINFGVEPQPLPLVPSKEFTYKIPEYKGCTEIGKMFNTLSKALSSDIRLSSTGDFKNIIILFSDGGATDLFCAGYTEILRNPAFYKSRRIAVSIGNGPCTDILTNFCTFAEDLHKPEEIEAISSTIRQIMKNMLSPNICLRGERKTRNSADWD